MAWWHDRYKDKRKDWQEEKAEVGSREADESMLHRAYTSEDASVHHLYRVSIYLDGVGYGITTTTSTGEAWLTTGSDRSSDSVISNTLF
jgi:hypothetical protein